MAQNTGAKAVAMAHQVGATPGADNYLATIDQNVNRLAAALGGGR